MTESDARQVTPTDDTDRSDRSAGPEEDVAETANDHPEGGEGAGSERPRFVVLLDRALGVDPAELDEFGVAREFRLGWQPPTPLIVAIASFIGAFIGVAIVSQAIATSMGLTVGPDGLGAAFGEVVGRSAVGLEPDVTVTDFDIPLAWRALFQLLLALSLAGPALVVAWRFGDGPAIDLGLRFRRRDVAAGLVIGILAQLAVPLFYFLLSALVDTSTVSEPARDLTDRATDLVGVGLVVFMTVFVAPFFEEIYYRGLVLRASERRFGPTAAVIGTSIFFAVTHGQLLQLPALLLFAVVLAAIAIRTGRIGMSIFAHVGFNLTTVVLLLAFSDVPI